MEARTPITCIFCGSPIPVAVEAVVVSKASLDENGEPDFSEKSLIGAAHPECWERQRPDAAEAG